VENTVFGKISEGHNAGAMMDAKCSTISLCKGTESPETSKEYGGTAEEAPPLSTRHVSLQLT
jgi:hypothetical protein